MSDTKNILTEVDSQESINYENCSWSNDLEENIPAFKCEENNQSTIHNNYEMYQVKESGNIDKNDESKINYILSSSIEKAAIDKEKKFDQDYRDGNVTIVDCSRIGNGPFEMSDSGTDKSSNNIICIDGNSDFIGIFGSNVITSQMVLPGDNIKNFEVVNNCGNQIVYNHPNEVSMLENIRNNSEKAMVNKAQNINSDDFQELLSQADCITMSSRKNPIMDIATSDGTVLPYTESNFNSFNSKSVEVAADNNTLMSREGGNWEILELLSSENENHNLEKVNDIPELVSSSSSQLLTIAQSNNNQNNNLYQFFNANNISAGSEVVLSDEQGHIVGLLTTNNNMQVEPLYPMGDQCKLTASPETPHPYKLVSSVNDINKPIQKHRAIDSFGNNKNKGDVILKSKSKMKSQNPQKYVKISKALKPNVLETLYEYKNQWDQNSEMIPMVQYKQVPDILVLHPLRTRRSVASRSMCTSPQALANKNVVSPFHKQFDLNLINVPLFVQKTKKNLKHRRKQQHVHLKASELTIDEAFDDDDKEITSTKKNDFDRYTAIDIPEVHEIFERKRKILTTPNLRTELKYEAQSSFEKEDSYYLAPSCETKIRVITKSKTQSSDSESSEDPLEFETKIGKSLKCSKCYKFFKNSRSMGIHSKLCKSSYTSNKVNKVEEQQGHSIAEVNERIDRDSDNSLLNLKNERRFTRSMSCISETSIN